MEFFLSSKRSAKTHARFHDSISGDGRNEQGWEGKLMYSVSGNTRKDPRRDCPKETKTPRSRGSREGVFVSLAKGMKNRESQPGIRVNKNSSRSSIPNLPFPPRPVVPPLSTLHQCQLTAYQGGWGSSRKNRDPCFNKVAFTSFGGDC